MSIINLNQDNQITVENLVKIYNKTERQAVLARGLAYAVRITEKGHSRDALLERSKRYANIADYIRLQIIDLIGTNAKVSYLDSTVFDPEYDSKINGALSYREMIIYYP